MSYSGVIAVWFSCGVASAVAAKLTLNRFGSTNSIRILNNPVVEEDSDNVRFRNDVQAWLGAPIEIVSNKNWPDASAAVVWEKRKFMSGPLGAPCTVELKKEARQQWERENKADWHVLGFTADEQTRHKRFILTERSNVIPVLIDAGLTKKDCHALLRAEGIAPPRVYALGYPNANCIGCVKATSPTYWNLVRQKHPEVFAARAAQSRQIGARLVRVNNTRMFLDELDPAAKGRRIKNLDVDCGVFCEEKPKNALD
jgi:hypothetical protein